MSNEKGQAQGGFRVRWRYFVTLASLCTVAAVFPILLVAAHFTLSGFKGNAFDENGYGVFLWLLIITVPYSIAAFVLGTIVGALVEIVRYLRR
jgi:ABC-type amino acid transport system permease subunit